MAFYFLELPGTGVKAEVEAPSTRSAQTSYLDYLTRNQIVPWKGRNSLRPSIIVDRIESGQMPVDVNLNYNLEQGGVEEPEMDLVPESQFGTEPMEEEFESQIEPQVQRQPPPKIPSTRFSVRSDKPAPVADLPSDLPQPEINKGMPIQAASKRKLAQGGSKIEQFSRKTLGKGKF